ncbi:hypothetical protein HYT23_01315 [Candidatus Pacearchaeota archaeon]|nr:hypothetical protein [Candidatus Pacearchaeota archaeon]
MATQEGKNKIFSITIIFAVLSLLLFLSSLFIDKESPIIKETQVFVNLTIGGESGLGIFPNETDIIRFKIIPGSSASKKLIATNDYEFKVKVDFEVLGDIKEFLIIEPFVYLEPGEKKEIGVTTILIPQDAEYGTYKGIIKAVFRKAPYAK